MTYHIYVSGRVQGVGYRRFAQKAAKSLSLCGWTRNIYDGRVEVIARGDEQTLDKLCEILKQGPSFSQVREVIVKIVPDEELDLAISNNEFTINPDLEYQSEA